MSKAKNIKQTVIEDSGDDSDSSLPIITPKPSKKQQVQTKKATKVVPKPESEEEEDTPVVQKKPTKQVKTQAAPVKKAVVPAKKPAKQQSSQEEESQDQKPKKIVKTVSPVQKHVVPVKKQPVKESSSQESEEEQPKKVVKAKSPLQKAVVPTKKPVAKPETSSEEESEEQPKKVVKAKSPIQKAVVPIKKKPVVQSSSEESEEVAPVKGKAGKPVAKVASPALKAKSPVQKVAKKPVSESQEESEQEKPVKTLQKVKSPVQKVKSPVQKALVAKKAQKVPSEQEEESEQQAKPVKKVVAPVKKGKAHKVEQEQEEEEDLAPKKGNKQAATAMVNEDEEGEFQICVKGLSFQAYESDIQELFNTFGNVLTVRLLTREDGKSRGLAFVKFSKKSSFNKALELNGSEQFGRPITVEESLGKKNNDGGFNKGGDFGNKGGYNKFQAPQTPANIETPTLFIGGLSYNSTKESIADFFSHVGPIMNARVVTDKQTGKPRGFGYVEFQDVETAKKAYNSLNGGTLDGRQIRLDSATQRDRPQGGFGGQGGYGGGQGGFGGGQGGFGGGRGAPRSSDVNLSQDDKNAKKGAMGTFQGKKFAL